MPKEGQKSITVNEETYEKAKKNAKDGSVAGYVTKLIDKDCKGVSKRG